MTRKPNKSKQPHREKARDEEPELVYESNPKHSEPWQRGARGSLCERDVRPLASELLKKSVLSGKMRYAVHDGKAYCAKEHKPGRWHGHPVGWREVPTKVVANWVKEKRVTKREIDKFWKSLS